MNTARQIENLIENLFDKIRFAFSMYTAALIYARLFTFTAHYGNDVCLSIRRIPGCVHNRQG